MNPGLELHLSHEEIIKIYVLLENNPDPGLYSCQNILQKYLFNYLTIEEMQKLAAPFFPH